MRPIATDTCDFPKLREKGCIYVDKTAFVHRMVSCEGTSLYFASEEMRRPTSVSSARFSRRRVWSTGRRTRPSNGRADIVAKHKKGIYIFSLKVDEPVDEAFRQIRAKGYAEPYRADGRPIWLVGLSFDATTRRLAGCVAKPL